MKKNILKWMALFGFYGLLGGFFIWGAVVLWNLHHNEGNLFFNGLVCGGAFVSGVWLLSQLIGEIAQSCFEFVKNRKGKQ
jgi:hypothetical protein